jgi:hypothetical protein
MFSSGAKEDERKMIFAGGGMVLRPKSVKVCVLYDPKDGHIVHTHQVIILEGGRAVDDEEVQARAFRRATRLGKNTSKLKALHVPPKSLHPSTAYRVDLRSLKLVEIRRPQKAGTAGKQGR